MIFPELPTTAPEVDTPFVDPSEVTAEPADVEAPAAEPEGADITGESTETAPEMFDLVVNGETIQVTRDELIKRAQKATAAETRALTAKQDREQALRLIELAKEDPFALIKHLQPDLDEKSLLSKRLASLMEEELLTPQERAHRAEQQELAALRKEREDAKRQQEEATLAAETEKHAAALDLELSGAITKVGLPPTPSAIKRVAEYLYEAAENNITISTEKVAQLVKEDLQREAIELLAAADDDTLATLLGKDLLTKAQRLSLKNLKRPGEPVTPRPPAKPAEKSKSKVTPDDFLREHGVW